MPSLLDTLDRFNHISSSIRSITLAQPSRADPGPFTAAILDLTVHDLLREADEAEYGLFTFVKGSSNVPVDRVAPQGKVGRREFRGATPLRTKRVTGTNREEEPEVYIEAALKYLDRFQALKPMPDAQRNLESLIDRLNNVRDNIERLQTSLDETAQAGRISPKSQVAEEERRINELKSRILQLRKRKESLVTKLPAASKPPLRRPIQLKSKISSPPHLDSPSSAMSTPTESSRFKPKSQLKSKPNPVEKPRFRAPGPSSGKSIPKGSNNSSPIISTSAQRDAENEQLFWSGRKPPRIPDKSHSLLDEELDMHDISALMSPPPAVSKSRRAPTTPAEEAGKAADKSADGTSTDEEDEDESGSGEPTVVVSKLRHGPESVAVPPSPPPSRLERPESQNSINEPQTPIQAGRVASKTAPPSTKTKVRRVRISAEVERVCAKIWSTIPDLLVPGNNFNSPSKRPPDAKDTLVVLQTIAGQSIPDPSSTVASPSTRSTLSSLLGFETGGPGAGSPHQIMTAHVLLSLLTAPNHEMPLTALKALLASKTAVPSPGPDAGREAKQNAAALGASAAQLGTRALYGCVAKKLVKIDRGGGEQIVKFDRM